MRAVKRSKRKIEVFKEYNGAMNCNQDKKFSNIISSQDVTAKELNQENRDKCVPSTLENYNMPKFQSETALSPSRKIKLQLFPINESTRLGVEKDGHNPYLELILKARKRMSSVFKHLNSKWGNSSIAVGELTLFPYNGSPASCKRWTMNDNGISGGDVYAAIGSPATFRLRYGWFLKTEPKMSELCRQLSPLEGFSRHNSEEETRRTDTETACGKIEQSTVGNEESRKTSCCKALGVQNSGQMPSDFKKDEQRMDSGISLTSVLWVDSLTSISIGGLLSEASFQGKLNNCGPKSSQNNSNLQQPVELLSDSLDALLAAQKNTSPHTQNQRSFTRPAHSSILDAEETCHAFTFQSLSSSKISVASLLKNTSGDGNHDEVSRPFKVPNLTEASRYGLAQGDSRQEYIPEKTSCLRVYHDESSLGLAGINWNDSLGPFDLGLPPSEKIVNGDSVGFSKFVS